MKGRPKRLNKPPVNNVRTVSDTKRAFYTSHTRPINSIYRRVVEELMVEMHLLSVNSDFRYDPIYALGVVTAFDRFMQGYRPEADKASIFNGLCQAIQAQPRQYRQDAEAVTNLVTDAPLEELIGALDNSGTGLGSLKETFQTIASNEDFKYSRLFAIGLYTLLGTVAPELNQDEARQTEILEQVGEALKLPADKLKKDVEYYCSNLEKLKQAQAVMEDILKADRKKQEERAQKKQEATTADAAESTGSDGTEADDAEDA